MVHFSLFFSHFLLTEMYENCVNIRCLITCLTKLKIIFLFFTAGAMKALFAKGIVHRDLKPQNILLSHSCGKNLPAPSKIILKIGVYIFLIGKPL